MKTTQELLEIALGEDDLHLLNCLDESIDRAMVDYFKEHKPLAEYSGHLGSHVCIRFSGVVYVNHVSRDIQTISLPVRDLLRLRWRDRGLTGEIVMGNKVDAGGFSVHVDVKVCFPNA